VTRVSRARITTPKFPAVLVDVQRVAPPVHGCRPGPPPQQADLLLCAYASHGDTKHILCSPAHPPSVRVRVYIVRLAEKFQKPVILTSDLDIGMNDCFFFYFSFFLPFFFFFVGGPRLTWMTLTTERGRVCPPSRSRKEATFHRYADEDGVL